MDDEALLHLLHRSMQLRRDLEEIEHMLAARAPHLLHPHQQQQELPQEHQTTAKPSSNDLPA